MDAARAENPETADVAEAAVDALLFDATRLRELASDAVVRRGIGYFQEDRVIDLGWHGQRLWATVAGSMPGVPYEVEVAADEDGDVGVRCSCPFDGEPACKHAVAALLAYAARQVVPDALARSAADEAAFDRKKRAPTEVAVQHVGGERRFGTWEARSLRPTGLSSRTYRVELRSVAERLNHCTCPDFATNRLGTCKHIEAVIHELTRPAKGKGRKGANAAEVEAEAEAPAVSVVYLDWQGPDAPRIMLRRGRQVAADLDAALARWFDPRGVLRTPWPDALARLAAEIDGRDDIHLSQDALHHAQRLAEDAAHAQESAQIRREIRRGGGHLEGVNARLFPYQVEGVAFLASTGRAVLADDMGLGKTLQTIAAATWLMRHRGVRRVLVVCPASLKHQWAREIQRFTGADVVIVQGRLAARHAVYRQRASWTLVNYELVTRDLDLIQNELGADVLVLDEAQRIKNWRTKTADAIKAIATRYAFVLTGTPLENRLEDLYSLMQVVDRRVLGPLWHFLLEYHVADERGKVLGYRNLSQLRRTIAPVMLRRDRRIVSDQLPARVDQRVDVELTAAQRGIEQACLQTAGQFARIAKRRPLTPFEQKSLLAALQNARMACNAAQLVDPESTARIPKLEELAGLLSELAVEAGEKVVIFSQWERMTKMAEEVARKLDLGVVRLHGGVPTASRGKLIDRFTDDPEIRVFISTDAGGVGLNLQSATVLINLDLPWNPAVLDQRIARVHRLGQKKSTLVLMLVTADSYEARVGAILESKRHLFTHVVSEDATDDVVGVSRSTLEMAVEALGPVQADADSAEYMNAVPADGVVESAVDAALASLTDAESQPSESEAASSDLAAPTTHDRALPTDDDRLAALVAAAQHRLGSRLERIIARPRGLLVVAESTPADVSHLSDQCPADLEIAVIPPAVFLALQRFGMGAPADSVTVHERQPEIAPSPDPHAAFIARKLQAATALMASEMHAEAVGLIAQATVAIAARLAGADTLPEAATLPVWLYTDAVPAGAVSPEDAALVLRAHALSAAPAVPAALAETLLRETHTFAQRADAALGRSA
ncbi:MAG: DEAD/DEAH box helicase [Myxococcota bacterium]